MALISPSIGITLISVFLVVVSRFIQSKMVDKKKMKEMQKRSKEKQKRIKELIQRNDEQSKAEVQRLQQEMFADMGESMQGSMRYMMVSMPLFLGVFFLMGMFYGGMTIDAPFPLPKFQGFFLLNPLSWLPVGLSIKTGWLKLYFFSYLITSIVVSIALKIVEKMRKGAGDAKEE